MFSKIDIYIAKIKIFRHSIYQEYYKTSIISNHIKHCHLFREQYTTEWKIDFM